MSQSFLDFFATPLTEHHIHFRGCLPEAAMAATARQILNTMRAADRKRPEPSGAARIRTADAPTPPPPLCSIGASGGGAIAPPADDSNSGILVPLGHGNDGDDVATYDLFRRRAIPTRRVRTYSNVAVTASFEQRREQRRAKQRCEHPEKPIGAPIFAAADSSRHCMNA